VVIKNHIKAVLVGDQGETGGDQKSVEAMELQKQKEYLPLKLVFDSMTSSSDPPLLIPCNLKKIKAQ
jgi:hypothetical protein